MASNVDDITISYEEDDLLVVKEIGKEILSKGAWATILFRYTQWDAKKGEYGPQRYSIRRYRKINNEYRQQSKFTISSKEQATKIMNTLQRWVEEDS
ncbi:MAG: hypothetical protein JXM72_04245 [Deltaproteobacteria bacterium]|nr:hypothetical protein [Deltaproteobacteria bacterium]